MKSRFSRFFALFATVFFAANANAQTNQVETYAITNARIEIVSGVPIEKGSIVIRNGLIESVGANVRIPADARVIDGSGLTVYPGLIDAASNIGIAATPVVPPQRAATLPNPNAVQNQSNSKYPNGLQPETSAADLVRISDASFETARNNGITTALIVPRDGIFLGESALVNLSGDNAPQAIIKNPVAGHIAFRTLTNGAFPVSLMGTFSALRQMLLDAQRLQQINRNYATNQRGVRRPESDKSLEALFPILNREMPIVMQADAEREIIRALDLAKEFNLRVIISGGQESSKVINRLKAQNAAVLLSLNFPKRTTASSPEAEPETLEVLRRRVEIPKTASQLQLAKIPFAFQSGGMTNLSDYTVNALKAVENGLGKADALRAMTTYSANILGVQNQLGTIEVGKIANLTVTKGDLFDKSKTFTHVFVDGKMYEIKQTSKPDEKRDGKTPTPSTTSTTPRTAQSLSGTWTVNVAAPNQPTDATFNLTQEDQKITGSVQSHLGNSEITTGSITADSFTFTTPVTVGGQTFDVVFTGKLSGNQISGTATTPQGAFPFTGTRKP
ncbi:MAG: amidohydrolase family protein [Pyrinomonadaceae bacterium]|nr:amidohydrolase family protein [Pyrinomonadaceae bacterium]